MASKQPTIAPDLPLVHQAIACLGRLADAFRRRREQLALSVGLSDGQWGVLEEISREHFMPSMFAKTRDSSAAAVSKTLRQLLDKDLVSVTLSKSDGRQRDYILTAKGKRIMQTLREERELAIEKIWLRLDPHLLKSFVTFGTQLSDHLEQVRRNMTMAQTLYEKVFDKHVVRQLPSGQTQLLMGLHLLHEVTSPQAFAMIRERKLRVMFPERTFATVDHIVPDAHQAAPVPGRHGGRDAAKSGEERAGLRHPLLLAGTPTRTAWSTSLAPSAASPSRA
jgi:DNA-binding MarR family transcriptional regulator